MLESHSAPSALEAALALSILDLDLWKKEYEQLRNLMGRHRVRAMEIQAQAETAKNLQGADLELIKGEADISLRHLSELQRAFDYACERCLLYRFLIVNHCTALGNSPIKASCALALEETSLEWAYQTKNVAGREDILPSALMINGRGYDQNTSSAGS